MMIRGGSLFAKSCKYCRRGMSSSRDLSSEPQRTWIRVDNQKPTRLSMFLFRSGLVSFGYFVASSDGRPYPPNVSLRESLEDKEKDLEEKMRVLECEEAILAKLESMSKASQD